MNIFASISATFASPNTVWESLKQNLETRHIIETNFREDEICHIQRTKFWQIVANRKKVGVSSQ
jgi:hypothetical protein